MNMDPDIAIQRFNDARGYKIERENYLAGIHRLSKDSRLKSRINQEKDETEHSTRPSGSKRNYPSTSSSRDYVETKRHKRNETELDNHTSKPPYSTVPPWRRVGRGVLVAQYPSKHHNNNSRYGSNSGYKTDRSLYSWTNKNQNNASRDPHQSSHSNKQYHDISTTTTYRPSRHSNRSNDV